MKTIEIVFFITMCVVTVLTMVLNKFQQFIIDDYRKLHKINNEEFNYILKFCLTKQMEDCIKFEDYETAKKCKSLIDDIDKAAPNIAGVNIVKCKK